MEMEVDPSAPACEDVRLALEKSGIGGDPGEWKVRTADGRIPGGGRSLIDEGVDKPARPCPGKGPGRGG